MIERSTFTLQMLAPEVSSTAFWALKFSALTKEGYIITPTELGLSWDGAVMVQQSALFSTAGACYQLTVETEAPEMCIRDRLRAA